MPKEIDPDAILAELENLDEDGNPKVVAPAKSADSVPAPVVVPTKPTALANPALDVAWDTVRDYVSETCPDLDDETVAMLMVAAQGIPLTFKNLAKRMQAKITAAKVGSRSDSAEGETVEEAKARLTSVIFDGGKGGGDAVTHQKPPMPTVEERLRKAQETGDSAGIMAATAQAIKDKKLFDRGITLIID